MRTDPLGKRARIELDPSFIREEARRFLAEDVGTGDATTAAVVPRGAAAAGRILARQTAIVAGLAVAREVFRHLNPAVAFDVAVGDGDRVGAGDCIATVRGPAGPILTGERTALNVLQRLSGIATFTRRHVEAIAGTGVAVSDTRKTTPGLRLLEKYAVGVGGGRNHRIGLHDAILIKDNHLVAAGGIQAALHAIEARRPAVPVQIEVDSIEQLRAALELGVAAVLLDNMTPEMAAEAVRLVRAAPGGAACWIEASGGITLDTIREYAETGVDTVSVGALTQAAPAVDLALDFQFLAE